MKRLFAAATLTLVAGFVPLAAANVILNGDFQAGNTGFTSAYGYVPPADIFAPATYSVVAFDTIHSSWVDFADHTTSNSVTGRYMIVNGTDAGQGPAWAQTVALTAGEYELSGWFASLFPASPAALQFRVIGTNESFSSPTFFAPLPPGTWDERTLTFTVAAAASFSIEIWDLNDQFTGNDYAIDDISLVPTPGSAALLGLGGLMVTRRRRN